MWGSYSNVPKTIFYLLKGDFTPNKPRILIFHADSFSKSSWTPGLGRVQGPKRVLFRVLRKGKENGNYRDYISYIGDT